MNYEKKYKDALKRAKNLHKDAIDMGENLRAKQCEIIFPELKELEDEKSRKEIIELVKFYYGSSLACRHTVSKDDMLAWLEKQGEQKYIHLPAWSEEDEDMFNKALAVINKLCAARREYVWSINTLDKLFYWLKSLKERMKPQWKPSEEQLKALNTMNVTGCITEVGQGKSLVELYEQLKKLKEE